MTLQEIRNINNEYQMVLSFSNNNAVVITSEDFDPNSKFMRRSKIRLGMDFEEIENSEDLMIFRTYRGSGKADYLVYLSKEYRIIESYRKVRTHSQTIKRTEKQMSFKDLIAPNKELICDLFIKVINRKFQWSICHPELEEGWCSVVYQMDKRCPNWYTRFAGVLTAIDCLSHEEQSKHFSKLVIHVPKDQKNMYYMLTGKYKTHAYWTKFYVRKMHEYKDTLAKANVSISFRLE